MSVVKRLEDLRNQLELHNYRYYVLDDPLVPDAIYDQLYMELVQIEKDNPALVKDDSPTQRVGAGSIMDRRFKKVSRAMPMLSIENAFEEDDILDFVKRHDGSIKKYGLCLECKLDGLGVELLYVGGTLIRATTRGNGLVGDDVTANCLVIEDIPNRIEYDGLLEVRGEVYLDKETLKTLNQKRVTEGKDPLANCRNAAAGGLKQKDPQKSRDRMLKFFCYGFGRGVHHNEIDTQYNFLQTMTLLGLKSPGATCVVYNYDAVLQVYAKLIDRRESIPYDVDGMVIKLNSLQEQASSGHTSKYPRGVIAYKFPASEGKTRINSITIQVGRTGALTPVAELEPIDLHGVTISRATLHNWEEIGRKDIRLHDYVMIQRAGDVIPAVVCSLTRLRDGSERVIEEPDSCPSCHSKIHKEDTVFRCVSPNCPERLKRSLHHMVSRNALNIQGLGKAVLNELVELGVIKDLSDVLYLTGDQLSKVSKVGPKKSANILASVQKAISECTETRFLFSLGMRHIGNDVSKLLITEFGTVEQALHQSAEVLQDIPGIGQVIAESASLLSSNEQFMRTVRRMRELIPVNTVSTPVESLPGPLTGKTIVITGSFSKTRSDMKQLLEGQGARVTKAVSSKTDYVLSGEKPGASKINKVKPPTTIISEDELNELLDHTRLTG